MESSHTLAVEAGGAAAPQETAAGGEMSAARRWTAVLLLTLVGILNYVDRFLPAVLAEPIKRDLQLSDTAIGLINGFGFLVIYAVLGIPIARLADRGRQGLVITGCLALWSVMTMLGGLAQSGWQLAATRMGVAVGEAGSTPAAHAFIARTFPPARRAAPLAVLTLSAPVATMLALIGGGLVAAALGWRNTFLVMGAVSLVIAPLVLVTLGTGRGATHDAGAARGAGRTAYRDLLRKQSFAVILVASACIGVGSYALTAFGPAFLMRVHGLSIAQVGVQFGVASGVAGALALALVGVIADRLSSRDPRWHLWVVAALTALFTPFTVAALLVSDGRAALILLALGNAFGAAYLAPLVAAIQRLAPSELRASASAIMLFCTAVLGGLGPLIAGMISDALQPELGAAALARGLLVAPIAWALGGLLYLAATRRFRAEMVEE